MGNVIQKTKNYFRRNGLKQTIFAVAQNLTLKIPKEYYYQPLSAEEIRYIKDNPPQTKKRISILVPAYKTNPVYFRELLESVAGQYYPYWSF